MFAPTYHLRPVKGDVVALAPTAKTWMQYLVLPYLVLAVMFAGFGFAASAAEKREMRKQKDTQLKDN